jgi:hypothetical protein
MQAQTDITSPHPGEIAALLRGEVELLSKWSAAWDTRRMVLQIIVIILGTGIYGAAMGSWRDPHQALFTAIKFPLILLLTTAGHVPTAPTGRGAADPYNDHALGGVQPGLRRGGRDVFLWPVIMDCPGQNRDGADDFSHDLPAQPVYLQLPERFRGPLG